MVASGDWLHSSLFLFLFTFIVSCTGGTSGGSSCGYRQLLTTSVSTHVRLEVGVVPEALATDETAEWFLPSVDYKVSF